MSSSDNSDVQQELQLIERVTQLYRRRLGALIDRLNAPASRPSDLECIRICVEAVDVVLASQATIASALDQKQAKRAA